MCLIFGSIFNNWIQKAIVLTSFFNIFKDLYFNFVKAICFFILEQVVNHIRKSLIWYLFHDPVDKKADRCFNFKIVRTKVLDCFQHWSDTISFFGNSGIGKKKDKPDAMTILQSPNCSHLICYLVLIPSCVIKSRSINYPERFGERSFLTFYFALHAFLKLCCIYDTCAWNSWVTSMKAFMILVELTIRFENWLSIDHHLLKWVSKKFEDICCFSCSCLAHDQDSICIFYLLFRPISFQNQSF